MASSCRVMMNSSPRPTRSTHSESLFLASARPMDFEVLLRNSTRRAASSISPVRPSAGMADLAVNDRPSAAVMNGVHFLPRRFSPWFFSGWAQFHCCPPNAPLSVAHGPIRGRQPRDWMIA